MFKKQIGQFEGSLKPVLENIKAAEWVVSERIAKGEAKTNAEPDLKKKNELQLVLNTMRNWKLRLVACREIMEQSCIVILQEEDQLLIVQKLDQRMMEIIKAAEARGAVVVDFKPPVTEEKQETLL